MRTFISVCALFGVWLGLLGGVGTVPVQATDGLPAPRMLHAGPVHSAMIAPDGAYVVFTHNKTSTSYYNTAQLFSVLFTGGIPAVLSPAREGFFYRINCHFIRDRSRLLIFLDQYNRQETQRLAYTIGLDGGNRVDLDLNSAFANRIRRMMTTRDGKWQVWQIDDEKLSNEYGSAGGDLFVMPVDGSQPPRHLNAPLASGQGIYNWEISPDGARVLYYEGDMYPPGKILFYSVPLAPGDPVLIDQLPVPITSTSYTPYGSDTTYWSYYPWIPEFYIRHDGLAVIYRRYDSARQKTSKLYVSPTTASEPAQVPLPPEIGALPISYDDFMFTPDHARIIYSLRFAPEDAPIQHAVFNVPLNGMDEFINLTADLPPNRKSMWFRAANYAGTARELLIAYQLDDDLGVNILWVDAEGKRIGHIPAERTSSSSWQQLAPQNQALISIANDQLWSLPRGATEPILLSGEVRNLSGYRLQFIHAGSHVLFIGVDPELGGQALYLVAVDDPTSLTRLSGALDFGERGLQSFATDANGQRVIFRGVETGANDPALYAVETGLPPLLKQMFLPMTQ